MIKQDYLLRIIQEIIGLIANALLNKQRIRQKEWLKYDEVTRRILSVTAEELKEMNAAEVIERYSAAGTPDTERIELAAMTMLKMADDLNDEHLVLKSKLRQEGIALLKFVQAQANTFSLQRLTLIQTLSTEL